MNTYRVVGLMSGSSLDGLDIACCEFSEENNQWAYKIIATDVVPFTADWIEKLKALPTASGVMLWEAHAQLGTYFGKQVKAFIEKNALTGKVDLVASHGHTIFHFPVKQFTTQIGDGAAIAAQSHLPVACDFRTADIAQGGQGTPIVPIGDNLMFTDYRFCLNVGGIANISCKTTSPNLSEGEERKNIVAFDICAANQVLNYLAGTLGKEYDAGGEIAAKGNISGELLQKLNALAYFGANYPKSLDNSFSRDVVLPVIEAAQISVEDKLRTFTEHIAGQIAKHIEMIAHKEKLTFTAKEKMLVTGGGAFNTFLIKRIKAQAKIDVVVPDENLVKFKEAIVIALMGALRLRNQVNVLKTVTGAAKDTVGGAIYTV